MMAFEFQLPPGAQARLHIRPAFEPGFLVAVTVSGEPVPETIMTKPGGLYALLTHDEGLSWPDLRGERLADATMAAGGGLVLAFQTMADALACHRRLTGGRA